MGTKNHLLVLNKLDLMKMNKKNHQSLIRTKVKNRCILAKIIENIREHNKEKPTSVNIVIIKKKMPNI